MNRKCLDYIIVKEIFVFQNAYTLLLHTFITCIFVTYISITCVFITHICSSFKIGFNSLCSHASVNHQHLHCYYTDEVLLADWVVSQLTLFKLMKRDDAICPALPLGEYNMSNKLKTETVSISNSLQDSTV